MKPKVRTGIGKMSQIGAKSLSESPNYSDNEIEKSNLIQVEAKTTNIITNIYDKIFGSKEESKPEPEKNEKEV
jgi:hypothetical protein